MTILSLSQNNPLDLQKPYFHFLLRSHIFIALCAVGLSVETSVILKQPFLSIPFYLFIFSSTLFTYNIYYIYSKHFLFHRILTILGLAAALITIYFIKEIPFVYLGIVSILSCLYILPIFLPFRKSPYFSLQKLFILIIVWVIITFLIPKKGIHFHEFTILLLVYRIVLLSLLCLLFFIRDEGNFIFKKKAMIASYLLGMIQLIISIFIFLLFEPALGMIYGLISVLSLSMTYHFNTRTKTELEYLFFIDGIMLLQSIFVLLKYSISP